MNFSNISFLPFPFKAGYTHRKSSCSFIDISAAHMVKYSRKIRGVRQDSEMPVLHVKEEEMIDESRSNRRVD